MTRESVQDVGYEARVGVVDTAPMAGSPSGWWKPDPELRMSRNGPLQQKWFFMLAPHGEPTGRSEWRDVPTQGFE